jgi:hypothetical protein
MHGQTLTPHGLLVATGRARIEAPHAFGTGEVDADR